MNAPSHLRCEYLDSPWGIDIPRPRFSWHPEAAERGTLQAAYQLVCSSDRDEVEAGRGGQWDSRKVSGERTAMVPYGGAPLLPFTRYYWRVRTWDQLDRESPWSATEFFETAALSAADWKAAWISMHDPSWTASKVLVVNSSINKGQVDARQYWAFYLRTVFTLSELPVRARVYSCGLGYHEVFLNGARVADRLDPGQTEYSKGVMLAATGCRTIGPSMSQKCQPGTGARSRKPGPYNIRRRTSYRRRCSAADEIDNMNADRAALAAYTVAPYDSAAIRKSEKANIQSVADALSHDSNTKLMIEGNCDERGTEEYNRALGERGELAARQALVKLGIDPMRIATKSFGKDKPVDPANNEEAWAKKRRDEFVLLHPK